MRALVIGCGRVGSALAQSLAGRGWSVAVLDRDEESFARLGDRWQGTVVAGHALDVQVLERAGMADSDAVVVATSGDNTNIVVAQIATKRYQVPSVAARILDPARAEAFGEHGFEVISPTRSAIAQLANWADLSLPKET